MTKQRLPHIVTYDIADPKRLRRIHRFMKKVALPLQYSVFLLEADTKRIEALLKQLRMMIKANEDDIRIYPLPHQPDWCSLGKPLWQDGVQLVGFKLPLEFHLQTETYWVEQDKN
jgi:CRISPR-associated protein Cas2